MYDFHAAVGVPGVGVVFDGVVADGEDEVGLGEDLVADLVAEEADAAEEEMA